MNKLRCKLRTIMELSNYFICGEFSGAEEAAAWKTFVLLVGNFPARRRLRGRRAFAGD